MIYSNSEIKAIIDEYIHSETDRKILKKRFIDGLTYAEIAEQEHFSERQIQRRIYKTQEIVFNMLEK